MNEELEMYTADRYWVHLTLPSLLDSIAENGLETGHATTEKQLFSEYFPESDQNEVVDVRARAETILERIREEVYGKQSTFSSRGSCVALWPSVSQGYEMRSAVLGDSVEYGVVIVDASKIENTKYVLSEYQLIAQTMMHVNMYQSEETDMTSEELVTPAWKYWRSATLTNSWEAITEQKQTFDIPEVLVNGGVGSGAIEATKTLSADPYDEENDEAPPSVTPK